ncbi:putative membrane protein [Massilia sp. UYP11]|uniref:DUF2243 domain-containing protein n=1 Tax=Massilia sp. UYP11 TaxID=1756385 RepID=UPI003D23CB2F
MLRSPWARWGAALGFALGGFFDGILLHQILQWHHLLSLVPGIDDLRLQVLWDGYFHLLMYVVALAGLFGLWRAQRRGPVAWGRPLAGALLVGFGAWHAVDALLSHWLLGIHRIRIDSPNPLSWDLLWLVAFGIAPLALGWRWLRRQGGNDGGEGEGEGGGGSHRATSAAVLALLAAGTAAAGAWALMPPPGQDLTTVVFHPGAGPREVFAALDAVDGRLVWSDRAMGVVVMAVPQSRRLDLYRHGALLVSGGGAAAGCFSWSRI